MKRNLNGRGEYILMRVVRTVLSTCLLLTACEDNVINNPSLAKDSTSTILRPEKAITVAPETVGISPLEVKEVFYGNWIVKGVIASGPVTANDSEDINKIIGTKISYGADVAKVGNSLIEKPKYKKRILSSDKLFSEANADLSNTGLVGDSIIEITIFSDEGYKKYWPGPGKVSLGGNFYVKNNDTIILYYQGDYLETIREK